MEQVNSRVVYQNPWMVVREDEIRRPDGSPGIFGVVEKPDFALVMPRWRDGFWLVEQFRYPVGRRAWEFPQGSWGHGGGGDQAALARQELAEEAGLRAESLTHLGHLFEAYGDARRSALPRAQSPPDRPDTLRREVSAGVTSHVVFRPADNRLATTA